MGSEWRMANSEWFATPVASDQPLAIRHFAIRHCESPMTLDAITETIIARGDLAHLALFLWAASASALAWLMLRELAAAMRRFDDFIRELSHFNDKHRGR